MCEATSVMAIMAVASTAIQVDAQSTQAGYQERVAARDAQQAEYAKDDAIARGVTAQDQQRLKVRQMLGLQRAAMAANGIDATSGTGSKLLTDSAAMGEFDIQTLRANSLKQAYGLDIQGQNALLEGAYAKATGDSKSASTLLTGGSKVYAAGSKAGWWDGSSNSGFGTGSAYGNRDYGESL